MQAWTRAASVGRRVACKHAGPAKHAAGCPGAGAGGAWLAGCQSPAVRAAALRCAAAGRAISRYAEDCGCETLVMVGRHRRRVKRGVVGCPMGCRPVICTGTA